MHVDAYRILGGDPEGEQPTRRDLADELESPDLESALEHDVVVVEWGAGFVESLVEAPLVVRMSRGEDTEVRVASWHRAGEPRARR